MVPRDGELSARPQLDSMIRWGKKLGCWVFFFLVVDVEVWRFGLIDVDAFLLREYIGIFFKKSGLC